MSPTLSDARDIASLLLNAKLLQNVLNVQDIVDNREPYPTLNFIFGILEGQDCRLMFYIEFFSDNWGHIHTDTFRWTLMQLNIVSFSSYQTRGLERCFQYFNIFSFNFSLLLNCFLLSFARVWSETGSEKTLIWQGQGYILCKILW